MRFIMLVYQATNKVNGKVYIGKTVRELSHAKARHKQRALKMWKYGCQSRFYSSISKHGWEAFDWEVRYRGSSDEDIQDVERFLIAVEGSMYPDRGYNMTPGGDGGAGKVLSAEQKAKLSIAFSGANNRCYGKFGENHPAFGNRHTEEVRQRISAAHKGKPKSEEQRRKLSETKLANSRYSLEDRKEIVRLRDGGTTYQKIADLFNSKASVICKIYKRETAK